MPAALTGADGFIADLIVGRAGRRGFSLVLFLSGGGKDQLYRENENPHEQVNDPPPPADAEPPQKAVALFLVFGFGFRYGGGTGLFLKRLECHVFAVTFWANHSNSP